MIEEFLKYMQYEKGRSPETVASYSVSLHSFEDYFTSLDAQLTWKTVDEDVIRDWMEFLVDNGMEASSVGTRLAALRSFFRYALSHGIVSKDPAYNVEPPKKAKPLPYFLKDGEMDRLLDDIPWGTTYKEVRDRAIIVTLYETGIRVSELTGLDDSDVDFVNKQLKVTGKGNKQRIVPFGDELDAVLRRYMSDRDKSVDVKECQALFLTKRGKRMQRQQVRLEVRDHLRLVSSQKKLSPHVLRHTFATTMLNHGASIESVRRLLGHASASTTEVYAHTTFEQLKRVYKNAHPRA